MSRTDLREVFAGSGRRGWIKRYGVRRVPEFAAKAAVAAGSLGLAEARTPLVWDAVSRLPAGGNLAAIANDTGLSLASTRAVLDVLERGSFVGRRVVVRNGRAITLYVAQPTRPDWRAFVGRV